MNNLLNEIYSVIRSGNNKILLFRNNEEREFLELWLNGKPISEIKDIPELIEDSSVAGIIKRCNKCGNILNKKAGFGKGINGLLILLNTPSDISRNERDRLKDESRDLLIKMISAIKMNLQDCYITNLIKCESDNVISRPGQMLKNCESILIKEIEEYNPVVIIVMGDNMPIQRIINERKSVNWYNIEHPLKLILKKELKKTAWNTLQQIIKKFDEIKS